MDSKILKWKKNKQDVISSTDSTALAVELYPKNYNERDKLSEKIKIPFQQMMALGVAYEPLVTVFQNIRRGMGSKSGLMYVKIPPGQHLAQFTKESSHLGTLLSDSTNQITGQARINPLIFDPTTLFMAAMLMSIEMKLNNIEERQKELMDFLTQKERSSLKGDLNFLIDIKENFKYNSNNEKYKDHNHIKVLDIKQSMESKIDFYRSQIRKKVDKKSLVHSDQEAMKLLENTHNDFMDYQMVMYIFAFSSYLEVMLLGNYDKGFLAGIIKKIENYSLDYRLLYDESFEKLNEQIDTSIQSHILKGVAGISKVAGEGISKVPLISKSKLDETLVKKGQEIKDYDKNRTVKAMQMLIERQSTFVQPFIDCINTVCYLQNQPMEIIFDDKSIYINSVAA